MTGKNRLQKLNEQAEKSTRQAILSAQQAHTAVTQAQSSLIPQEIQYAEQKVSEALTYVRHAQNNMEPSISTDIQENLKQEEARLLEEYELF